MKRTFDVGIDKPLAAFRLPIEPSAIGKPPGSVFDLILGRNARTDAVILCMLPGTATDDSQGVQAIPPNSLKSILAPYTEICQAEHFINPQNDEFILVTLLYSKPNDVYHILAITVR